MSPQKNKKSRSIFYILLSLFFIVLGFGLIFYFYLDRAYTGKIYPNVYVVGIDVGGKDVIEAKQMISNKVSSVNQDGVTVYHNASRVVIYPINSSSDGETTEVLIDFDIDKTIEDVYLIGRSGNAWNDFRDRLELFLFKKYSLNNFEVSLDNQKISSLLKSFFNAYESNNASYYIDENGDIQAGSEYRGRKIDYDKTIFLMKNNLERLDFSNIQLVSAEDSPLITKEDCLRSIEGAKNIASLAPIVLSYEGKEWSIEKKDIINWMFLEKNSEGYLEISLSKEKIIDYLKSNISKDININPIMPKFSIENGKVKNFIPGEGGIEIDLDAMANSLAMIPIGREKYLTVPVKKATTSADIKSENGTNFRIKDIIGQSSLSFAGSTAKRIKNITNASNAINGLLIKPNEEFSAIKTLSPIDGTNGYAKEIVINGRDIKYEYGGGVCHLSTTLFRAILDSGLPITMRQNHSYNMPYYYPAGTDASVYDPKPDLRFINDTGNYVLIQSKVVGSELVIQLWGTDDGRIITKGKSVVYNVINPNPAKMTPTDTLPKGKISCSYAAYSGADAYFDYKVEYKDGTIKEKRFNSHYVPRQGVCMVGE
ncbi:MAG: VanW family protein [Candidatus Paceibacterota bacterium]